MAAFFVGAGSPSKYLERSQANFYIPGDLPVPKMGRILLAITSFLLYIITTFGAEAVVGQSIDLGLVATDHVRGNHFGTSVAISGSTAVVGDSGHGIDSLDVGTGAAHVFRLVDLEWEYDTLLVPGTAHDRSSLGHSVATNGNVIVVGAPGFGGDYYTSGGGAAYVFRRPEADALGPEAWKLDQQLKPSNEQLGAKFGDTVGIGSDFIVVGSRDQDGNKGAAYLFVWRGQRWDEVQSLNPANTHEFGSSIAVRGDRVVIGAGDAYSGFDDQRGHLFVYRYENRRLHLEAELAPPAESTFDGLGHSVALFDGVIVAGAPNADLELDPGFPFRGRRAGVVHVFAYVNDAWQHREMITAGDVATADRFGWSVGLYDRQLVVGSIWDDDAGSLSGSIDLFAEVDLKFKELGKFVPESAGEGTRFGYSVAIGSHSFLAGTRSGNLAVAGQVAVGLPRDRPVTLPAAGLTLDVYPNPTSSSFSFDITGQAASPIEIRVHDMLGRIVHKTTYHTLDKAQTSSWTPDGLASGVYLIVLRQGAQVARELAVFRR